MAGPDDLTVPTRSGRVRGRRQNGVRVFTGIPYGAPTAGRRRFRPPRPAEPWSGIRDARQFGHYCPQVVPAPMWCDSTFGAYMTGGRQAELIAADIRSGEDCLVLNVLAPAHRPGDRPVLVHLHGGGYDGMCGSITTLADRFVAEQDVVLVSINHRLTAFGFLYLGGLDERYATGNVGLLDLVLALRWVRDNIGGFGGDPGNVTVFGESGGGSKILDLMAMPAAQGLFQRAILQCSGWPDPISAEQATETAREFLDTVGVDIDGLSAVPTDDLLAAVATGPKARFWPVRDGRTILDAPWQAAAPGCAIPLIVGNCRDEMTNGLLREPRLFELDWPQVILELVRLTCLPAELLAPTVEVFRRNRPDAPAAEIFRAIMSGRLREISDRVAELQSARQLPVYRYDVTYGPPMEDPRLGAFHGLDAPLALRLVQFEDSERLSQRISAAWGAFARTGDPNHDGLPEWRPYGDRRATMILDHEPVLRFDPHSLERIAMGQLPPLGT
ncbi:MAG TPA: carboxylesterase family protein [Mycobacteriales bacterium]|nr:carboxylesterase family protein [Mycobacteriales bacterium]